MQDFYLVTGQEQLDVYQQFVCKYKNQLQDYISFLKKHYQVLDLPQAILWADYTSATELVRQISVPAYTNDTRMVMTLEKEVWQTIYLRQLEDYPDSSDVQFIRQHYHHLSERSILQIIGHELAHWSELFLDDFEDYDRYIWFEEGMVEYISRDYFLTPEEFEGEKEVNKLLVKLFKEKHGWHSLNEFGQSTYDGDYASIFYEYWRSFLTVNQLVENLGSVETVFQVYQRWAETDKRKPLLNWLIDQDYLEKEL